VGAVVKAVHAGCVGAINGVTIVIGSDVGCGVEVHETNEISMAPVMADDIA